METKEYFSRKKRVVVKIGSASLHHAATGRLNLGKIERLVRELCDIRNRGMDVCLALKQLTDSSDNKQRYTILRKIGCDENMINKSLFRQIGIFFGVPLVLAIIHSIFGIQFAIKLMSGLASEKDLLPSAAATVVIIGVIYGAYFLATYFGSKNIIKEE